MHFEAYPGGLVNIHKKNDIPPKNRKEDYRYQPMSAKYIPPVGPNHMMHLYDHSEEVEQTALCYEKIPRKRKYRLVDCAQRSTAIGWGIQLVEGLDIMKLWLLGLVGFFICTAFGLVWSLIKNDIQVGFAITACMLVDLIFTTSLIQAAIEPK